MGNIWFANNLLYYLGTIMSDFRDKAVDKIMRRFFNSVIVTTTWFLNYIERNKDVSPEELLEIRAKLKELKDLMEEHS